jgi:adenylate kinase
MALREAAGNTVRETLANSMAQETSRDIGPVVLLGPPGAGKGTQAKRIMDRYQVPQVSTGDLLRQNIAQGTEVGCAVKAVMARGELASDDLVCEMVRQRLRQPDCEQGYVLDGFPRTEAQAEWLDAFLENTVFENSHPENSHPEQSHRFSSKENPSSKSHPRVTRAWPIVIRLDVDYNQLLLRITGRRSCPTCGRIYNVHFQPPAFDEVCDVDGSKLVTRNDDRLEVIQPRITAYQEQTGPVADYYQRSGRLIAINGDQPMDVVTEEIFRILEGHRTENSVIEDQRA